MQMVRTAAEASEPRPEKRAGRGGATAAGGGKLMFGLMRCVCVCEGGMDAGKGSDRPPALGKGRCEERGTAAGEGEDRSCCAAHLRFFCGCVCCVSPGAAHSSRRWGQQQGGWAGCELKIAPSWGQKCIEHVRPLGCGAEG